MVEKLKKGENWAGESLRFTKIGTKEFSYCSMFSIAHCTAIQALLWIIQAIQALLTPIQVIMVQ